MSTIHPVFAEHLRKRWMRPDAYRFAWPGSPERKMSSYLHRAAVARAEDDAKARAPDHDAAFAAKVKALQASQDWLWRMLAEVKYELAWRRFVRKYSPDQPRSPKGNSDGGQWTRDAGKVGSEAAFSPGAAGWHDYGAGPNLVCAAGLQCPHEEMVDQLARFSLPGGDPSMPIENGKTYRIHIPGADRYVGDVRTRIEDDGLTIESRTVEGHMFFDGLVTRKLTQTRDGAWYVTTRGLGNNIERGMNIVNELVGPEVFNELDRQMRANIERHHAKGILDLAVHRVDGRGRPRSRDAALGERDELC